jgi:hypothetical protein
MPRYYVKNQEGNWNIWSTITDSYLYSSFMPFAQLKEIIIQELVEQKTNELNSLLTDHPELNIKSYEECEEELRELQEYEEDEVEREKSGPRL